jgi:hypothetical protein
VDFDDVSDIQGRSLEVQIVCVEKAAPVRQDFLFLTSQCLDFSRQETYHPRVISGCGALVLEAGCIFLVFISDVLCASNFAANFPEFRPIRFHFFDNDDAVNNPLL